MSTALTKKDISKIAFETAIKAAALHSMSSANDDPIFINEACELTGYSKATIYSFVHKNQIPFHKAAGRRLLYFLKKELLCWMATGSEFIHEDKEGVANV